MRKILFPAAVIALGLAAAARADAPSDIAEGTVLGTDAAAVGAALVKLGYEVRKVEAEDDDLEAYALKDGHRYEIYVDTASGAVSKVKADD